MSRRLDRLDDAGLIEEYVAAALVHSQTIYTADARRGNRAYARLVAIRDLIRERGREAQQQLAVLLTDPRVEVRGGAAAHMLEFDPVLAEAVLVEIAAGPGIESLNAEMVLRQWRAGRLDFQ